jgi:RNA polymerase sigma factor (sigma-70 family)
VTVDSTVDVTEQFEAERGRLRGLAYRMLGSLSEADDAVQEAWLRLARTDAAEIQNLPGWLTTVTARICLDMLRARTARREDPLEVHVPDPVITFDDPQEQVELADAIGLALLVVLDTLTPRERIAFVLHDLFAVPFDEIARIVDRSPAAAKQLASRARRRLRSAPQPEADAGRHREVLAAFTAAAREGDFDGLMAVLAPDVLLRADAGVNGLGPSHQLQGAENVARQAMQFAHLAQYIRPVLVNGRPGLMAAPDGRPVSVMDVTVRDGRIVEMNILADPDRLARLVPRKA